MQFVLFTFFRKSLKTNFGSKHVLIIFCLTRFYLRWIIIFFSSADPLNWWIHLSCYFINYVFWYNGATNYNDHCEICLNRWIFSKSMKFKHLSIYPYLILRTLTPRADYLTITDNKPCRCCTSASNLSEMRNSCISQTVTHGINENEIIRRRIRSEE